jgi:hypothetical protein
VANVFYDQAKKNLWNGVINLAADPLNAALVGPGYDPDRIADEYWSDVAAHEIVGDGYTAGGRALSGQSVTADTANHRGKFTADDVTWPNASIAAAGVVVYKDTGDPATSPLVGYIDFDGVKSSHAGNFTIRWDVVNGIAYF